MTEIKYVLMLSAYLSALFMLVFSLEVCSSVLDVRG